MTPTEPKSDEEMAEEFVQSDQCCVMDTYRDHKDTYLAGMAAKEKQLGPRLRDAESALRDILGYCDEKPEDCRIYEHMVAREYFAKHGEKGRG